jgi:hypothetical protein
MPRRISRLALMREWTLCFRESYTEARRLAETQPAAGGGQTRYAEAEGTER